MPFLRYNGAGEVFPLPNLDLDIGDGAGLDKHGIAVRGAVKAFADEIHMENSANLDGLMKLYYFAGNSESMPDKELIALVLKFVYRTALGSYDNVDRSHNEPSNNLMII